MKKKGIVISRREGVKIYYSIASNKIFQACMDIEELMHERMEKNTK
jgi:DNA-binding transcriptional ArsR family regulator